MVTFTTTLLTDAETGSARYIELPPDVAQALGAKARLRIQGTLNGAAFATSLAKYRETRYVFPVKKALRQAAGIEVGDVVAVTLEAATAARPTAPDDVRAAMEAASTARAVWERLPPSHQRKHLEHIEEAMKAETRARRIGKLIERLRQGAP